MMKRLFNRITDLEKVKTNYKDVNDNKIDFLGQTTATIKTNNTTLQLPLLITEAYITWLMGLDWMKLLGIALNPAIDDIKIHNNRMDDTKKKFSN